jgi:hypothetical protein
MLRSALVAAFSAVVALGVLSGLSGAKKVDVRADTAWPAVAVSTTPADTVDGAGS